MSSTVHTMGATTKLSQHEILPAADDIGALANRINAETKGLHEQVNKMVTFRLALALRDSKVYRQGLQSFYHCFAAIEKTLHAQLEREDEWTEMYRAVWKPEFARADRAFQDLMFYYDDRKDKFSTPIMSEQIEFSNHIQQVCAEKPHLLFAYLHVMYLALFAGGRIMRSSFARATGMFPHKDGLKHEEIVKMGTNLFNFDVADENLLRIVYKRDYELVTRAGLTEEQKLDIIQESKYIFEQNGRCLQELERHNMKRLKQKWGYLAVTKGPYVGLGLALLLVLFYVRRIILHLF